MRLTIERLNGEYLDWTIQWGQGRNNQDLRFSQYLDNKYDLELLLSEGTAHLFYKDGVDAVYEELLETLYRNNVKNTL